MVSANSRVETRKIKRTVSHIRSYSIMSTVEQITITRPPTVKMTFSYTNEDG